MNYFANMYEISIVITYYQSLCSNMLEFYLTHSSIVLMNKYSYYLNELYF